jgi:hypothetical protein
MFSAPDVRLDVSNKCLLESQQFFIPITLRSEAKTSQEALAGLRRAYEDASSFISPLSAVAPGILLVPFEDAAAPRVSRVNLVRRGKEHKFDLTFAFLCPLPVKQGFWDRLQFVSTVYDRLTELGATFEERRGIGMFLDRARLDQEKEEPERGRIMPK